jgi:succinoglycan biosynthesis transport protein ExoP
MTNEYEPIAEKEINLRDYLQVVRKRKNMVIAFFIITNLMVAFATFSATPLYQASAKLLIEKNEANPLNNYGYVAYDPDFLETQTQIITSSAVGRKVVSLLNLEQSYDAFFANTKKGFSLVSAIAGGFGRLGKKLSGLFSSSADTAAAMMVGDNGETLTREDELAVTISGGITVAPVPESRIVDVSYTSPNPVLARMIANAVSRAYIEKILDMRMQSASYEIEWMTGKAEEERIKLEQVEAELQQYIKDEDIVTIENRLAINPQKLSELTSQYTQAETQRKQLESVYQKISQMHARPEAALTIPVVANNPSIQAIRTQILAAEQNVSELSKKYGPKHPVMKRAKVELESLKTKQEQEIRHVIDTVETQYELARENEASMAQMLASTKSSTMNINERFIQYEHLKRKVENGRQLYDALVNKISEQRVTDRAQTTEVWVVEEAATPEAPVSPNKKRNLMLGLLLGVMGGIGLAFFIEYLDNTVKSPDDAQERFGLPVLGTVPRLDPTEGDIEKILLSKERSNIAESYKTLRTAIMLSAADTPPKGLLVTSMLPEEGKTTSAVNLAISLALTGKTVLLVDGDLRKPRVHKIFGLDNSRGISTYLAGASEASIYQKGPLANLTIVASGPSPPNPSELLSSEKLPHLIQTAQEKYDFVVFDSAPVMTVTDALILSRLLTTTLVVIRASKTTYEVINKGLERLKEVKAPVAGLVINDFKLSRGNSYYYHYYHYDYYTQDPDQPKKR